MDSFRVAMVQMPITASKEENVNRAVALVEQAAQQSPHLVVLPENFCFFGTAEEIRAQAETLEGPTIARLRETAKQHKVHIVAGTLKLRSPEHERLLNTSCLIDDQGEIAAVYHKVHIFDATIGGVRWAGLQVEENGSDLVVVDVHGVPVGLSVCYDIRFPELYRILTLRGARVIVVPSMFTLMTGRDHWEVLLRARAIENQVYMVAPGVCGQHPPRNDWAAGRSMVVDPWGLVVAQAQDKECVLTVDLDLRVIDEVRTKLPSLRHRQPRAYVWPQAEV